MIQFNIIKTVLFVFVLLILSYAIYMAYTDISKNMPKQQQNLSEQFSADEAPKLKICLFKATWCGHCTTYLKSNVFDDTYASIKDKNEYKGVIFATYDFDQNKQLAEKYNINSFPSIVAVDSQGNLVDTFEGDRYKKDDIVKFIDSNKHK